ncbi:MAG: hypothetical protein ACJ8D9_07505, partial [Xanthobacteraceae bacterium]
AGANAFIVKRTIATDLLDRRGACRAAIRIARGWSMPNDAIAMKHLDPSPGGIEDVTRDGMDSLRSAPATTLIGTRQGVRK